jgi:hypothetical protein
MSPVEFEPTISAGEWPQTYALYRATTGIGFHVIRELYKRETTENNGKIYGNVSY